MNIKLGLLMFFIVFSLSGCSGGQRGVKQDAIKKDLKEASLTNIQLGVGYLQRGEYQLAQEKLLKAIDQDSNNVVAYTTLAYMMMQVNKMEEAEDYYLDALDIKENDPELRNGYGTLLCRVGRVKEAIDQFKEAYDNPFYKSAYLAYSNAGTCLLQAKKYKSAEKLLRKALKLQPELSGALMSMAELSIKTKSYMSSRAYIQRYHAINKPTAESLWVQVLSERALGAKEHYHKYASQLLADFPGSKQASLVKELKRRDRIR
ncbi:MAG: type IV pilus biogenesis/stability protein PilW [Gammaproteobacteria bacterium]|nr:type IV pilus biogenesis/stability protein PilW [Gammaproteobacteria bacterium]